MLKGKVEENGHLQSRVTRLGEENQFYVGQVALLGKGKKKDREMEKRMEELQLQLTS